MKPIRRFGCAWGIWVLRLIEILQVATIPVSGYLLRYLQLLATTLQRDLLIHSCNFIMTANSVSVRFPTRRTHKVCANLHWQRKQIRGKVVQLGFNMPPKMLLICDGPSNGTFNEPGSQNLCHKTWAWELREINLKVSPVSPIKRTIFQIFPVRIINPTILLDKWFYKYISRC